jgi:hydrogenase maturation factor
MNEVLGAVVAPADADQAVSILSSKGKRAYRIGHAVADPARTVTLVKQQLVGRNKPVRAPAALTLAEASRREGACGLSAGTTKQSPATA